MHTAYIFLAPDTDLGSPEECSAGVAGDGAIVKACSRCGPANQAGRLYDPLHPLKALKKMHFFKVVGWKVIFRTVPWGYPGKLGLRSDHRLVSVQSGTACKQCKSAEIWLSL